ncbi:PlsC domain-containing protein [Aphelenchoides besseyi]|nr:PlsC domain-containing protein [Aphelenchoides besseyi]
MVLSVLVVAVENRAYLPAGVLAAQMIPFASLAIVNGTLSWIIPKHWYLWLDNRLYETFLRSCLFVFENCIAAKKLKEKPETSIILSNHQSGADWVMINMLAARQQVQYGLRFVIKHAIHYTPLYGWYTLQRGYVYVRRFGSFAPKPIIRQLDYLANLNQPFWLHIFPEGRSRLFVLSIGELRGVLDSIYDVTIAYGQTLEDGRHADAPTMYEYATGRGNRYNEVHIHVRRFFNSDIPTNSRDIKEWLYNRFVEKDELMTDFYATGQFPEPVERPTELGSITGNFLCFAMFTSAVLAPVFSPNSSSLLWVHDLEFAALTTLESWSWVYLDFFTKSLVERKTYKCRANGMCDIGRESMRNSCRACRLKKCREAGMKGEVPSAQIHESLGDFPSPNNLGFSGFSPELNYRNFCSAQRSLFIVENPRAIFSTPEFKPLKRSEHERMERGSIALLHTMLMECSEAYHNLPKQAKLLVIRHFSFQFGYLHRCYLTSQIFPELKDGRMCVHYGQFIRPLIEKSVHSTDMFRELQIREIELVAMAAITFYNVLADLDLLTDDVKAVMDAANTELHHHVVTTYGISGAGARLGRIFSLMHHIAVWSDLELPDDQSEVIIS